MKLNKELSENLHCWLEILQSY